MQDLRDKLLKAGLVTNEQAKRAEAPAPRPPRSDRPRDDRGSHDRSGDRSAHDRPHNRGSHERRDENRSRPHAPARHGGGHGAQSHGAQSHGGHTANRAEAGPRIPKLPPLPGSREYQRLESRKQLELDRKLLELARGNEIAVDPGAQTFYFVTRKGRLRRLELSPEQAGKLERGELAIVERREPSQIEHALVTPAVAEQMRALSDKSVRFLNTPGAAVGFLSDADIEAKKIEEAALGPEQPESAETAAAESDAADPAAPTDAAPPPSSEEPT